MLDMPRQPSGARQKRALLAGAAIALVLYFVAHRSGRGPGEARAVQKAEQHEDEESLRWPKRRVISDLETLWEVPKEPRGVLFVAHGCSHAGSDWWPPSKLCPHCLGLPEEMVVRQAALRRGYAVVAVTSFDRDTKCWHNTAPARSEDLKRVPDILRAVIKEEGLGEVPLYSLGGSSGGSFALRVAAVMPEVKGAISQITPVSPSIFELDGDRSFPPTLFVHMAERDPSKAETVTEALAVLKKAGTPAAEVKVGPRPCTPDFLQRSPLISAQLAQSIHDAMREAGFLDEDGYFKEDPRKTGQQWRVVLRPLVGGLSLAADVSQVTELFNVAYARHELIGDTTDVSLSWLEARGKADIGQLLREDERMKQGSYQAG